jgi:hypothetical protein
MNTVNNSLARLLGANGDQASDADNLLSFIQQQGYQKPVMGIGGGDITNRSGEIIPGALFLRQILGERQRPGFGEMPSWQDIFGAGRNRQSFFGPRDDQPEYVKPEYSLKPGPYTQNLLASMNRHDQQPLLNNHLARLMGG